MEASEEIQQGAVHRGVEYRQRYLGFIYFRGRGAREGESGLGGGGGELSDQGIPHAIHP